MPTASGQGGQARREVDEESGFLGRNEGERDRERGRV
jgi:hypothetical protein